jgi:hypothetical protein
MEMILLLVWRHLAVYTSDGPAAGASGMQNFGASMRVASTFDPETFREEVSRKLAPVVHRLGVMVCTLFSATSTGVNPIDRLKKLRASAGTNTKNISSSWRGG